MKKIKINKKLNLNKTSIATLNSAEQMNLKGGVDTIIADPKKTHDLIICGGGTGCVCTTSQVKTCGIYCPPTDEL